MTMTAEDILGLTRRELESRYSGNVLKEVSALIKEWHPDVCKHPKATDVLGHLMKLKKSTGRAKATLVPRRTLSTRDGRSLGISPLSSVAADQGEIIVNRNTLATIFSPKFSRLAENEVKCIAGFSFSDSKMRAQMSSGLPHFLRSEVLQDGSQMVIVRKAPGEILLSDLLEKQGSVPDVHVAWICSGLMNISAWLEYAGIVHGAISPEHILIDPASHSVRLVAGWAFATPVGVRPVALPGRTLALIRRLSSKGQAVETVHDRELVRKTICEALGDPTGTNGGVSGLPAAISTWITLPPLERAVEDYAQWQRALENGWGGRRFVKYDLDAGDIYSDL